LQLKAQMSAAYDAGLAGLPLQLPAQREWATNVHWMYGVVVSEQSGHDAASLSSALAERGVQTRPFFTGMHAQPVLRERGLFHDEDYPVTDRLARQGLYLPSGMALTSAQQDVTVAAVREILG
jgi:perosamine synthetase